MIEGCSGTGKELGREVIGGKERFLGRGEGGGERKSEILPSELVFSSQVTRLQEGSVDEQWGHLSGTWVIPRVFPHSPELSSLGKEAVEPGTASASAVASTDTCLTTWGTPHFGTKWDLRALHPCRREPQESLRFNFFTVQSWWDMESGLNWLRKIKIARVFFYISEWRDWCSCFVCVTVFIEWNLSENPVFPFCVHWAFLPGALWWHQNCTRGKAALDSCGQGLEQNAKGAAWYLDSCPWMGKRLRQAQAGLWKPLPEESPHHKQHWGNTLHQPGLPVHQLKPVRTGRFSGLPQLQVHGRFLPKAWRLSCPNPEDFWAKVSLPLNGFQKIETLPWLWDPVLIPYFTSQSAMARGACLKITSSWAPMVREVRPQWMEEVWRPPLCGSGRSAAVSLPEGPFKPCYFSVFQGSLCKGKFALSASYWGHPRTAALEKRGRRMKCPCSALAPIFLLPLFFLHPFLVSPEDLHSPPPPTET